MLRFIATSIALALSLGLIAGTSVVAAGDIPQAVKDACSDDYQQHCSTHQPESGAARDCMADAFGKLSDKCVTAILNSDLVEEQNEPQKQIAGVAGVGETDKARPVRKVTKARKAKRIKKRHPRAHRRNVAHRNHTSRRKRIARRINRAGRIARSYVSRALAKAFR